MSIKHDLLSHHNYCFKIIIFVFKVNANKNVLGFDQVAAFYNNNKVCWESFHLARSSVTPVSFDYGIVHGGFYLES